ncbi:MAG: septal ring lytic transglycosylase RlpA family protein [Chloroflexota bacterium]
MPAYLARIGVSVFAMLFAIALVTEHQAAGKALGATANVTPAPAAIAAMDELDGPVAVAAFQAVSFAAPALVVEAAALVLAAPAPAAQVAVVEPQGGIVLASWYGPGFYGNRTACGQVYTPEIIGVAHKTLPCGTLLTLTYGSRVLVVPVIDRGPYIAGRTLDLSNATKLAIGCTDLCTLRMQIGR